MSAEEFLENVKLKEERYPQIMDGLKLIKSEYADYFKQNPPKLKDRIVDDLSLHYIISSYGAESNFTDISLSIINFLPESNLPYFIKDKIMAFVKSVYTH